MEKTNKDLFNDYLDGIISSAAQLRRSINGDNGDPVEVTSSWVGDLKSIEDSLDDLVSEVIAE